MNLYLQGASILGAGYLPEPFIIGADNDAGDIDLIGAIERDLGLAPTPPAALERDAAEQARRRQALASAITQLAIAGGVGLLLGGVGGALLWPAHRILGFFLGSILIGGPIGGAAGTALAARTLAGAGLPASALREAVVR